MRCLTPDGTRNIGVNALLYRVGVQMLGVFARYLIAVHSQVSVPRTLCPTRRLSRKEKCDQPEFVANLRQRMGDKPQST